MSPPPRAAHHEAFSSCRARWGYFYFFMFLLLRFSGDLRGCGAPAPGGLKGGRAAGAGTPRK